MTLPEIAFAAVVLLAGIPAAVRYPPLRVRNLTAFALVLAWLANQWAWHLTEGGDLTRFYLVTDMLVMGAIYCKREAYDCVPYRDRWGQLAAFWCERSYWDRAILAIFGIMWCTYAVNLGPYLKWAILWWLAAAQFLCAAGEAFHHRLKRMANTLRADTLPGPPGAEFRAWKRGRYA